MAAPGAYAGRADIRVLGLIKDQIDSLTKAIIPDLTG